MNFSNWSTNAIRRIESMDHGHMWLVFDGLKKKKEEEELNAEEKERL